jgi:PleD family two-component response regulator
LTHSTEDERPAAKAKTDIRVVTQMTGSADEQSDHIPEAGKILLVGDITNAFPDTDSLAGTRYEVCANVADAIDAAATNNFAAIAVVVSGIPMRIHTLLKDLKDRCDAKIILLAKMYEEPTAMQLVHCVYNGATLAQDYLICPVRPDTLYESATATGGRASQRPGYTDGRRHTPESDKQTEIYAPVETTVEPSVGRDESGRPAEAQRIRQLEQLATEDDLTGLKNRRYIREFARQITERAKREGGQVTLLIFDIDDFKHYNDRYGHATGDDILKQAAVLVRRCCRTHDVVGRIGGDEFAVVFWDDPLGGRQRTEDGAEKGEGKPQTSERRSASASHPREVLAIAERFIEELEKAELPLDGLGPEGRGVLTISGGLASFPRDGQTSQDLFRQADKALMDAKRSGKNRIYLVGKPTHK